MTGYYYGYKTDVPCGTGGFIREDELVDCSAYMKYENQLTKECFAVNEENVLTKMNCDNPSEPESSGGWDDFRRRQLQIGGYSYQLTNEEIVLEKLLGYFDDLPIYTALDDDDGLFGEYLNSYENPILSKNYFYGNNDGDGYFVDRKFNIVRTTMPSSSNTQFPSYTEVSISGYNDDSRVKITSSSYAEKIGIAVGTYSYKEFKEKVDENVVNEIFQVIENFYLVKYKDTVYIYENSSNFVDEIYTYDLLSTLEADSEIYKMLNEDYEYEPIGEGDNIYDERNDQFILVTDSYYFQRLSIENTNILYYESVPVKRNSFTRYDLTMARNNSIAGMLFNTEYELEYYCEGKYTTKGFYTFDELKTCSDFDNKIGNKIPEPDIKTPVCVMKSRKENSKIFISIGCGSDKLQEVDSSTFHFQTLKEIENIKSTTLTPKTYTVHPIPEDYGLIYNATSENSITYTSFTSDNRVDITKAENNVYATVKTIKVERKNYNYMTAFKVKEVDNNQTGLIFYNVAEFTVCCRNVISELENNKFYSIVYLNEKCGDCENKFEFLLESDVCSSVNSDIDVKAGLVDCKDPVIGDELKYDIKTTSLIERETYKMIYGSYPDVSPTYPVPDKSVLYREENTDSYNRNFVIHDNKIKTEINVTSDSILGSDISFLIVYDSRKQELINNETNYKYSVYTVNEIDIETSGFIMTETLLASAQVFYGCPENMTVGFVSVKELENTCTNELGQMQVLLDQYSLSNKVYKIALKQEDATIAYELNGNLMFSDDSISYTISRDEDGGKDDNTSNHGNVILPSMILLLLLSVLIL